MLWNILSLAVIIFFVSGIILLSIEYLKNKRNPVLLMINHDKRFEKINSIYTHKINKIRRGE